jgi:sugar phosphate isomerase/epimerase
VSVSGFDADPARLPANLGRLGEEANAQRVVLEFLPYTHIRTLKEACEIVREIAISDAGILVDALHLNRSGGTPADIAACDPALFPCFHICDAPATPPPADPLRAEAAINAAGEAAVPHKLPDTAFKTMILPEGVAGAVAYGSGGIETFDICFLADAQLTSAALPTRRCYISS